MFSNEKIVYIFVSLEEDLFFKDEKKISFFNKIFKKFQKKEKNKEKNFYQKIDRLIGSFSKYSEKTSFIFHLNLESTHDKFIKEICKTKADKFYIIPLRAQYNLDFNKVADFFSINFSQDLCKKLFWIKSYSHHSVYIKAIQRKVKSLLKKNNLDQKDTKLLFLAKKPKVLSPLYLFETENSCQKIVKLFPYLDSSLVFLKDLKKMNMGNRKNIIIVAISTLVDDFLYLQDLKVLKDHLEKNQKNVFICKTLNHSNFFIRSIFDIINEKNFILNEMLLNY